MNAIVKHQPTGLERNGFLDTLRGVAILGVVCVHFGGSFAIPNNAWSPSFYTGLALNQFFSFAVPLFIFISGLLASPYREQRKLGLLNYYFERILTIGWPYLIASIAAFFLLGVRHEFEGLATDMDRIRWLLSRFFYYGIHPTYYFIPMIFLLYICKPFLSWLAPAIHRYTVKNWNSNIGLDAVMVAIFVVLLAIHALLGILGYQGVIDYYSWCRPNPLFWAVYFYFGLVFHQFSKAVSSKKIKPWLGLGIALIAAGYILDWRILTDISVVGNYFENSKVDYAYARPEILVLNLLVIIFLAGLLVNGVNNSNAILSFLGKQSLHIYLWHIPVLYFLAWRYESVLSTVRSAPELIVEFAIFTAILISVIVSTIRFLLNLSGRYSVSLKFRKLGDC